MRPRLSELPPASGEFVGRAAHVIAEPELCARMVIRRMHARPAPGVLQEKSGGEYVRLGEDVRVGKARGRRRHAWR